MTASAVYNAMLHLTSADIPRNSGCYRPIRLLARPGSVVNVMPPAPEVGGNSEISPRIVDLVFAALAPAMPDRAPASSGGTGCNFLFGGIHPLTGEYYANYHMEGCGWGGRATADGNDAQGVINGNCRNTPVEVFETRYPVARARACASSPDSGGAGRFRGGLASERMLEVAADAITVSEFADRAETRPWGLYGGGRGDERGDARAAGRRASGGRRSARRSARRRRRSSRASCCAAATGCVIRTRRRRRLRPARASAAPMLVARDREEGFVDG